jgi:hypothetical protein
LDHQGVFDEADWCIMAISFGSLLGSASPALDQWVFLLMTAILVDNFLV